VGEENKVLAGRVDVFASLEVIEPLLALGIGPPSTPDILGIEQPEMPCQDIFLNAPTGKNMRIAPHLGAAQCRRWQIPWRFLLRDRKHRRQEKRRGKGTGQQGGPKSARDQCPRDQRR